jgi:cystathionine beta-lyase
MKIDFDEAIDRVGTNSFKWDGFEVRFPGLDAKGSIPMWVADTDFRAPQVVIDALIEKVKFGIYGYPCGQDDQFNNAVIQWIKNRHGWQLKPEWIVFTGGVVPAINFAIQAFTEPNEGIIVQRPVYYPFMRAIHNNRRRVVNNALRFDGQRYRMDFDDLERKAQDPNHKLMILCNPHNPIGYVWGREDLERVATICMENKVLLFSDEIHSDLIMKSYKHIPVSMLSEAIAQNTITAYAPSKTFNLAGLKTSAIVIPNERRRQQYADALNRCNAADINDFGRTALIAAYTHGADYLRQELEYIEANFDFAVEFGKKRLPQIKMYKPEGTYLAWVDFRNTGLSADEIDKSIIEKAKVAGDLGRWFGPEGSGFIRFNFACTRATLEQALLRLETVFN